MSKKEETMSKLDDSDSPIEVEKSAETIFREIVRQYNLQMDSHDTLKDKANSIIIATGTIITLVTLATIQILNLTIPNDIKFLIGLILIPYFFLILSEIYAIKSYLLVDLDTIDAESFFNKYYRNTKVDVLDQLSSNIAEDVTANMEKSDERKKYVNAAMKSLERGIITFAALLLIIFFAIIYSSII